MHDENKKLKRLRFRNYKLLSYYYYLLLVEKHDRPRPIVYDITATVPDEKNENQTNEPCVQNNIKIKI